ncbi:hypothetical protein COCMIDRAFT_30457 [Bipolaris oryzae ATCC 44560]|uniref:Uncharacterized protein n=1 Tax=Bipolaris oryzae ATCC 44560 TaxID=930090 RepID=W6YMX2_COCMI|nr:uncharacterized protein COCMIDRAFT_30457 [Bipolaris oryzae ATCC 44560]EUC40642.1 hypothetical protein COCMIDRAFT_30457 [Bipolaris oryzae ATCC 44560]
MEYSETIQPHFLGRTSPAPTRQALVRSWRWQIHAGTTEAAIGGMAARPESSGCICIKRSNHVPCDAVIMDEKTFRERCMTPKVPEQVDTGVKEAVGSKSGAPVSNKNGPHKLPTEATAPRVPTISKASLFDF